MVNLRRVLGPKYYNMKGIWDVKPYYLGPWTLRDLLGPQAVAGAAAHGFPELCGRPAEAKLVLQRVKGFERCCCKLQLIWLQVS